MADREVVCVLGPSGSGKSTLLRAIAGLEVPAAGSVRWDGDDLTGIAPHRRHFGLMFQDHALFPHRDVLGNVEFGLRMQHLPAAAVNSEARGALARVGLAGFEHRRVRELSGGEQQRVALARALAPDPRLLMLDEPLGSLDRELRERLAAELRSLFVSLGVTALFVTHDQDEAFALADRVVVMRAGRIEQVGPPEEVWRRPATEFTARFLGFANVVDVESSPTASTRRGECSRPRSPRSTPTPRCGSRPVRTRSRSPRTDRSAVGSPAARSGGTTSWCVSTPTSARSRSSAATPPVAQEVVRLAIDPSAVVVLPA